MDSKKKLTSNFKHCFLFDCHMTFGKDFQHKNLYLAIFSENSGLKPMTNQNLHLSTE